MKNIIFLMVCYFLLIGSAAQWQEKGPLALLNLQFEKETINNQKMQNFVNIIKPSCEYCRKLKEIVEQQNKRNEEDDIQKFYEVICKEKILSICSEKYNFDYFSTMLRQDQLEAIVAKINDFQPKKTIQEIIDIKVRFLIEQAASENQKLEKKIEEENDNQEKSKSFSNNDQDLDQEGKIQSLDSNTLEKRQSQAKAVQKQKEENNRNSTIIKLSVYALCFLLGGFYFLKLMVPKDEDILEIQTGHNEQYQIEPNVSQSNNNKKVPQQKEQVENLVDDVCDEDL